MDDRDEAQGPEPDEAAASSEEPATVVEAARELVGVGRDLLQPAKQIIEDQASRVERMRSFVRDLDSNYMRGTLLLEGVAGLAVSAVVIISGFTDAPMFILMEVIVGLAVLRWIRAGVEGMRVRRWIRGLGCALLSAIWAFLLYDRIRLVHPALFPAQRAIWRRMARVHGRGMRDAPDFPAYEADLGPKNNPAPLLTYLAWLEKLGLEAAPLHLHGNVALIGAARS